MRAQFVCRLCRFISNTMTNTVNTVLPLMLFALGRCLVPVNVKAHLWYFYKVLHETWNVVLFCFSVWIILRWREVKTKILPWKSILWTFPLYFVLSSQTLKYFTCFLHQQHKVVIRVKWRDYNTWFSKSFTKIWKVRCVFVFSPPEALLCTFFVKVSAASLLGTVSLSSAHL